MWLNPNSVILGSTCVSHTRCYRMNPGNQINILLHPCLLLAGKFLLVLFKYWLNIRIYEVPEGIFGLLKLV